MPISIGSDSATQSSLSSLASAYQGQFALGNSYAGSTKSQIRQQVDELLSLVPSSGSKVSFSDIFAYRDELKQALEERVTADLESLGVDLDEDMQLSMNSSGEVVCTNDHPDQDLINRYFKASPDVVEQYSTALRISQLTDLADRKLSTSELKQEMQSVAMQVWFADNTESLGGSLASILSNQGLSTLSGLQLSV